MRPQMNGGGHPNLYLVTWGQNVCQPLSRCGACALAVECPRIGVVKIGKKRGRRRPGGIRRQLTKKFPVTVSSQKATL